MSDIKSSPVTPVKDVVGRGLEKQGCKWEGKRRQDGKGEPCSPRTKSCSSSDRAGLSQRLRKGKEI